MISSKKKLLLLHSSNDLYGASKIFLQLIDLFISKDFNVHVVLPEKGKLDDYLNKKDITVSYHELGVLRKKYLNPLGLINRLVTNLKAIKFLSKYIKDHSIDLVYTNTSTILCGGIAAKKNGIPSLFHIHEIPTGNKLYEFFSGKIINRYSSKVLTVSNSVKNHWLKYIDDKKIERIYNGLYLKKQILK
jgi:UDP-N-acetylglucosamine:LPS N-acetylglucosamine transferase